jgi:hypothetical protein
MVCRLDPPPPGDWFLRLKKELRRSPLLAFVWYSSATSGAGLDGFVRAYDAEQLHAPTGRSVLCQLAERARAEGVLERCASAPEARGAMIDLDLDVTPGRGLAAGASLAVSVNGPAEAAPFVECLSRELRGLVDRLGPVQVRDQVRTHIAFDLPPTPRLWHLGELCPP